MFCPQCGTNNPDGTHFCSNCGTGLAGQQAPAGIAPPAAAQPPPPGNVDPAGAVPPGYAAAPGSYAPGPQQGQGFGSAVGGGYQMGAPGAPVHSTVSVDFRRLGMGDLVAAGGTVLLFISLFLSWYSATGQDIDGNIITISSSALGQYAGGFRFLVLVLAIVVVLYLLARTFAPRGFRLPLPHWQILLVVVGLQFLLTILTFFIKPSAGPGGPGVSWSYGAYIGLVAAIIAVAGGVLRRNEPEVIVPGAPRAGFGSLRAPAPAPMQMGGAPVPGMGQQGPQGSQGTICQQCGTAVGPGTPYCTTCGAPIQA